MMAGGPEDENYDEPFEGDTDALEPDAAIAPDPGTTDPGTTDPVTNDPVTNDPVPADPFAPDAFEQERVDSELALGDDDDLPWLESGEEEYEPGVDTGRIVGFVLIGLLALAAILGGIWWATNRGGETEIVADGSTIPAPEGPIKSRPDDPGGQQVAGTGDVAPLTGEGRDVEGRVAEAETPSPSLDVRSAADAGDDDADSPAQAADEPAAPAASGVAVQVGAYSSRDRAEAGWQTLTGQSEVLSGVRHRVVQGTADIGTVYRLQALAGSATAASDLCRRLKADGIACQVKN